MRINVFIAQANGLSRRAADQAVEEQRVHIGDRVARIGDKVSSQDTVTLDGQTITISDATTTIMLNKPVGYVCSRNGQGSSTIYDLLPAEYHHLKPVGRLDKDSSGLLLLTDDGQLANQLTHPRYGKAKVYEVELDKPLSSEHKVQIEQGVELKDGLSTLKLESLNKDNKRWQITMTEGRNRQIRRTFAALGYTVTKLHRTQFGAYRLGQATPGSYHDLRLAA